jgi:hypothetical protein
MAYSDIVASFRESCYNSERLGNIFQDAHAQLHKLVDGASDRVREEQGANILDFWLLAAYHGLHAHLEMTWDMLIEIYRAPKAVVNARDRTLHAKTSVNRSFAQIMRILDHGQWPDNFFAQLWVASIRLPKKPGYTLLEKLAKLADIQPDFDAFLHEFPAFLNAYLKKNGRVQNTKRKAFVKGTLAIQTSLLVAYMDRKTCGPKGNASTPPPNKVAGLGMPSPFSSSSPKLDESEALEESEELEE